MRLYLDTSALVKLYVEEAGSSVVRKSVEDADTAATSIVAFVEARAAFVVAVKKGYHRQHMRNSSGISKQTGIDILSSK